MVQLYVSDSVSRISFADGRVIVWSEELGEPVSDRDAGRHHAVWAADDDNALHR